MPCEFPEDFLLGCATSVYQVECHNENESQSWKNEEEYEMLVKNLRKNQKKKLKKYREEWKVAQKIKII